MRVYVCMHVVCHVCVCVMCLCTYVCVCVSLLACLCVVTQCAYLSICVSVCVHTGMYVCVSDIAYSLFIVIISWCQRLVSHEGLGQQNTPIFIKIMYKC